MKKLTSNFYNTIAITVGLAFVFFIAAIKRIEEQYDDENFWE